MNYVGIIIVSVLYIVLTHLVANLGEKREIGYRKSVFWSIIFTPIIGFIRTIISKPIDNK